MRWFKNLKVAGKLALIGLAFAACMLVSTLVTHGTMSRVQVNGPLYEDIVRNKDVLADVLPPPEYILETHLVAHQMLESPPSELDALVKRAQQLKADFVDRHQHWASALPAGAVRDTLLDKSQPPALRYFDLLEKPFLDALRSENRAAARALLLGAMSDAYAEHRAAIDKVVELANAESAQLETDAAAEVGKGAIRVILVNGAGLLVVVAFMAALAGAIRRPLERAVSVLRRVAEGDFTQSLDLDTKDEMGVLAQELNRAVTGVRTALLEVQSVSRSLAAASEQLSSASQDISSGAQEQAASLEQAAASLKELSSTVKQNADGAQNAKVLASGARDAAEKGGQVVQSAVLAMGQIADSSKRIADIITTIDEIAFQTNLLALNAAVEAARAGDQGRGFAVVAAEVRTLAQRSASAAKETKGLIRDSGRRVNEGSEHVNASGENLTEIVSSVKRVTDMVSEIAAASREQNSGVDQVSTAVSQMNQVTQSNAAQTEELSSTAQTLASQAEHLEQLVERFKLGEETRTAGPETRTGRVREASRPRGRPATSPKGTHVRNERPPVVTQSRTPDVRQLPPSLPPANSAGRRGFDEF